MAHILVSWIATKFDFLKGDGPVRVDPEGPTADVHRYFWEYDRHLLLSQQTEKRGDPKAVNLQGWLSREFPEHAVEPVFMALDDIISVATSGAKSKSYCFGMEMTRLISLRRPARRP